MSQQYVSTVSTKQSYLTVSFAFAWLRLFETAKLMIRQWCWRILTLMCQPHKLIETLMHLNLPTCNITKYSLWTAQRHPSSLTHSASHRLHTLNDASEYRTNGLYWTV